jgi:HlyD family secretion protein
MKRPPRPALIAAAAVILTGAALGGWAWWRGRQTGPDLLRASGRIEVAEVHVSSKVTGRVAALHVREGNEVKAGQLIAELEGEDLQAQLRQTRAVLLQNQARLKIARLTRDRNRELLSDGAIARQEVDRADSEFQAAEAAEKEAAANVRRLETQVAELKVFAPLDGTVLTKAVETGEVVPAGKPLILVGDLDQLWIKIYVPETQVGKVTLGAPARILVDSFPDRPFPGAVTWIADQAEFTPKNIQTKEERVNLVYAVKISVRNVQRQLKAGMTADAELLLGSGAAPQAPDAGRKAFR